MPFTEEPTGYEKTILSDLQGEAPIDVLDSIQEVDIILNEVLSEFNN